MKIYTKTGDGGVTGLFGGLRVSKDDPRIVAVGELDELNACIGSAASFLGDPAMRGVAERLQREIFILGGDLATPDSDTESKAVADVPRVTSDMIGRLESEIDRLSDEAGPLTAFILPGGSSAGAQMHLARCICRRAERSLVALANSQSINPLALPYLNRLSDHLFVFARVINRRSAIPETKWLGRLDGGNSATD